MRILNLRYLFFLILILLSPSLIFATDGDPNPFGNSTHDTAWIGGSAGILNVSGILTANTYALENGTDFNTIYGRDVDTDTNVTTACSGDKVLLANGTCIDIVGNEWITPAEILDVDKEDIESDINTFVDIAGDNMTGTFYSQDVIPKTNNTYFLGKTFLRFLEAWISTLRVDFLRSLINITSEEFFYGNGTNIKDYFGVGNGVGDVINNTKELVNFSKVSSNEFYFGNLTNIKDYFGALAGLTNNTDDLINFSRFVTNKYFLGNGTDFDALYGYWEADTDTHNTSAEMFAAVFKEWDNLTGIPHATPSDGDTTHFSLADEIYDWVIGLSYVANAWDEDGDIDADEINESKIAFFTPCPSGSYYYLVGNDLGCKADPMDTSAEWATLCTNCVDNTDLGPDSVDLTSDALSSAYAGDGLTGGGTLALAVNTGDGLAISADAVIFDCSDVTGSATDGIACSNEDLTVAGGTCLTATTTGLGVTANCIGVAQLLYDTNQHLNTSSNVQFGDIIFTDEVKPDGTLCSNNDLLFKTGTDDWDCKSCAEITGSADLCDSDDAVDDAVASIANWQTLCDDCVETSDVGDILDASHITDIYVFTAGDTMDGDLQVNTKIKSDDTVYIDDTLNVTGYITALSDIQIETAGLCIDADGACTVADGYLEIEKGALCIDDDGSLDCSGTAAAGDLYMYDGLLSVANADSVSCTYATDDGEICAEHDVEGENAYFSDFFDDGTNINTLYVLANTWTSIDNYPSACTGYTVVQGLGDTLSCYTPQLLGDTSPQLGGYLDTNAQNIGSTADEIENIYIATNSKIYLGDGQEAEIYYNGTALRFKVT